ncbi:hypothetical protein C7379_11512 [Hallella colorans]|uniref:Uncharacterized protein n=1 Tax=Hallella colorans TaxID=1703337 RepID=A0A2U0U4Q2_9BACT|nr:hypothetical protein C7379_11512 [Hallella colorans]
MSTPPFFQKITLEENHSNRVKGLFKLPLERNRNAFTV